MTIVEIIIAELHCLSNGVCVRVNVAVNVVCAGDQCTCETYVRA